MKFIVVLVLIAELNFGISKKLPSTFKRCSRNDEKFNDCLTKAIQHALELVKDGMPQLGIPSLDPIVYGSITVGADTASPVNLVQNLTDVKIYNLPTSKIEKAEISATDKDFKAVILFRGDHLYVKMTYDFNGRILILPLTGHGAGRLDFFGVQVKLVMTGDFYEKKEKTHVKLKDVQLSIEPDNVSYDFENLFNGNAQLQAEFKKLVDESWRDIYRELRGPYEEALGVFAQSVFQVVFDRVPYDDLFPV